MTKRRIYLDYQATTPLDPRVAEVMQPYLGGLFGNPHSEHIFGWEAAEAVDRAAGAVADLIGASPREIIFTSGATEANNLAIQGVARSAARRGDHVITTAIEHKCVLNTALMLRKWGFRVDVIPVKPNGIVDLHILAHVMSDDTALVSVMFANNEIGTVQPIPEIGALCRERGIIFHTDAAQAVGKLPIDIAELKVDLLSLSGHKVYGPKGIGALYVSRHCPTALEPLIVGGAQQQGLRAGTVPPFLCVGLGEACRIAGTELEQDQAHCEALRDAFWSTLSSRLPDAVINGELDHRLLGNLNVLFPGSDADSLLASLQGEVAASTGSACNAGLIEPSYVLLALGLTLEEANSSIRFGFGRFTSIDDVQLAATLLADKAEHFHRTLVVS
jgi:cysteine desulfurase